MHDSSKANADSLDAFVERAVTSGQIWGLASRDGWAVCASSDDDNIDVYPFWSQEAAARRHCVDEWSVFRPAAVSIDDFIEDWLPGMEEDEVLAGTDWNADLEGLEVEPAYLAELLARRLQSH